VENLNVRDIKLGSMGPGEKGDGVWGGKTAFETEVKERRPIRGTKKSLGGNSQKTTGKRGKHHTGPMKGDGR